MAITRAELRVGETYKNHYSGELTVLFKGDRKLFCRDENGGELAYCVDAFLENHSLKPKPKKTIELVGFVSGSGTFHECLAESKNFKDAIAFNWKRISSRTIEVEE
ncbi:MAG TPA: hypothetical protein VFW58_11395 [Trichococcus sp.]|nr:hypothetical protein [Trichococcus sp.]